MSQELQAPTGDGGAVDQGEPVFALVGIRKSFGATTALKGVDVALRAGEFVGLLGPNGAGKSTLIKILDGVITPDAGRIEGRDGRRTLGVVHQDLGLVETLTIAENLFLGRAAARWIRPGREAIAAREAMKLVGLDLDPFALVESLSLGQRTMVAVARLLRAGAHVVVVDEVTAGLHPAEADWLIGRLRDATRAGATVVMVTHKLREIIDVADRFVVLVDGLVALDEPATATSLDELVTVMSSHRSTAAPATRPPIDLGTGKVVCTLTGACTDRVGPIDLEVRAGVVMGVTGLIGSGLHDVAYLVAGRARATTGTVQVTKGLRRSCVPAHRETEGMFPDETEEFNLSAGMWSRWRTGPFVGVRRLRTDTEAMACELSVVPNDLEAMMSGLSGGNQQKVVLGRALIDDPQLLVLCEPTRGVDVATRRDIYRHVRRIAEAGTAVFVASSDLEDLVALADTASILGSDGRISDWVTGEQIARLADELVLR